MHSVSFEYEFNGLTINVEADIEPGEDAVIDRFNPENACPGSGPEVINMTCMVGDADFDPDNIRYSVDASHTYMVNDKGEICYRHSGTVVHPFTARRLRTGQRQKRPVYSRPDTFNLVKTGEEWHTPVYEDRDLAADIAETAVETYVNQ